jgi:hypothetical protein
MWCDDTANASTNTTSGFRCLYCVLIFPTDAKRKKHLRKKHAGVSEPRPTKTPLVWDSPVLLPWGWKKIKAAACYTAIPQTWVPLTTGLVEPVVLSSFSVTTYAPTPQPPPSPVVNQEHYQTFLIPVIPQRSTATTETQAYLLLREPLDNVCSPRKTEFV